MAGGLDGAGATPPASGTVGKTISTVLVQIAMRTEAEPLVKALNLEKPAISPFPPNFPWLIYSGRSSGVAVHVVVPGEDPTHEVDQVGTVPASLLAYAAIRALKPDLLINAGTAGGFRARGAAIGDVFVATQAGNHDRRIPLPGFQKYGVGLIVPPSSPNLVRSLGLKVGALSTGNSLDMCADDQAIIQAQGAVIKDMEGAAVAFTASLLQVPYILLKAVTDIVDGDRPTSQEFIENLTLAAEALLRVTVQILDFVAGKNLTDL